jgi:hypothetical protein
VYDIEVLGGEAIDEFPTCSLGYRSISAERQGEFSGVDQDPVLGPGNDVLIITEAAATSEAMELFWSISCLGF